MTVFEAQPESTGRSGEMLPNWTSGDKNFGWWGMVFLIGTEAMIFGALLASYWYVRFQSGPVWPPGGIEKPTLALPLIMSAILWASSLPVHLAVKGIERGDQRRLRWGLFAGFLLGAVFLTLQLVKEYPEKLAEFTPAGNIYGSLFYGITGLHGVHVAIGLLLSLWCQVRAWNGHFDERKHVTIQNFAMYWHFVDVVWVFVVATIYLSPSL